MKRAVLIATAFAIVAAAAPASALNPQPLPPKSYKLFLFGKYKSVLLNPQPLPPRYKLIFRR